MAPFFRSGEETPWGGDMLRDAFMKDAPEQTGESLEVSALPGRESMVRNGAHAGKSLARMVELWGEELTGKIEGEFPLLLKLIDAKDNLSVQVHPGDEYAGANEGGKLGKTEAWIILNCEEGAKMAYGVNAEGKTLSEIFEQGGEAIEAAINWVNVRPGDVYYIPNGMVHAIGAGIQIYEIQQSSDVTYRFWDWGRVGKDGQPRELHTERAVEVSDAERKLSKIEGTTVLCKGGSRTYYISEEHFELCRLNVSGKMPLESGRMLFLTPMSPCTLRWGDESLELAPFDSVVVPAALEGAVLEGNTKVLMSSLPNQEALRAELGYRASNVAGLVD
jgi:mannose-6-phosphate isomerase